MSFIISKLFTVSTKPGQAAQAKNGEHVPSG
jgi:hypothetical protein